MPHKAKRKEYAFFVTVLQVQNMRDIKKVIKRIVRNTGRELGIYSSGRIYGISIRSDEEGYTRLEAVFPNQMTRENIKEFYDIYDAVDTNGITFYIYTECSTSYEPEAAQDMIWMPTTRAFLDNWIMRALNSQ